MPESWRADGLAQNPRLLPLDDQSDQVLRITRRKDAGLLDASVLFEIDIFAWPRSTDNHGHTGPTFLVIGKTRTTIRRLSSIMTAARAAVDA